MNNLEHETKQWMGLPLNLLWGYVAIALFMTGDGFELAFLSKYITDLGFTEAQSSAAFTVYGLAAALAAWISGVFAEIITPRKAMLIGFAMWCIFHVLFLIFGLGGENYFFIMLFYGIRGFAYPLFLYSFIVMIVQNVKSTQISPSMGWFWTTYSVGIGVFGSFIPSITIPMMGEMGTLWLALAFCFAGGLVALLMLRNVNSDSHMHDLPMKEKFSELSRAITLLITNRNILFSSWVRIINTLSLFGFAVIMPMMFTRELGFTTSQCCKSGRYSSPPRWFPTYSGASSAKNWAGLKWCAGSAVSVWRSLPCASTTCRSITTPSPHRAWKAPAPPSL